MADISIEPQAVEMGPLATTTPLTGGVELVLDDVTDHAVHNVRIVLQGPKGRFYLHLMGGTSIETGEQFMTRLKGLWQQDLSGRQYTRVVHSVFWKPVIEEAVIRNIPSIDLEALQHPIEVMISTRKASSELTSAFYRPSLMHSAGPFIAQYPDTRSDQDTHGAILVAKELNKPSLVWIVSAALVGSILIGLLVALSTSRADLGIASTSGLFAMISIIAGVLCWIFK